MSDGKVWYLNTAEGQQGPYTAEELRSWVASGQITAEWFVWREGLPEWSAISGLPELAAAPAAPPAPPTPPAAPVASKPAAKAESKTDAKTTDSKGAATGASAKTLEKPKKKLSKGAIIAVVLLVVVGGAGAYIAMDPTMLDDLLIVAGIVEPPPPPPPPRPQPKPKPPEPKKPTRDDIMRGYYDVLAAREAKPADAEGVIRELWMESLGKEFENSTIMTGVSIEVKKRSQGPPDLVVFDSGTEKIILIAEVVAASDSEDAVKAAKEQLEKYPAIFEKEKKALTAKVPGEKKAWPAAKFGEEITYRLLGGASAVEADFDSGVDLSPAEAETIMKWIDDGGPPEKSETAEGAEGEKAAESDAAPESDGGGEAEKVEEDGEAESEEAEPAEEKPAAKKPAGKKSSGILLLSRRIRLS